MLSRGFQPISSSSLPEASNAAFGEEDAYIAQISPDLEGIKRSIYVGGSGDDCGAGIAVSSDGVYVAGWTESTDLSGAINVYRGKTDAFISILPLDLNSIDESVYIGCISLDKMYGITISSDGEIYAVGYTQFPKLPNHIREYAGRGDAFLCQLANTGGGCSVGGYSSGLLLLFAPGGLLVLRKLK